MLPNAGERVLPTAGGLMRHEFTARPVYRFNETEIQVVFCGQGAVAGTFVLQTGRDLFRGVSTFFATSDIKTALLDELRNTPSGSRAAKRWRYWRYLPEAGR